MMEKQRNTFVSKNGKTKVNYYEWSNGEKPKAILQIAHGVTEYAERYTELAEYLSDKGIMVIANDHIGHGYSQNEDGSNKMCFGEEGSWIYPVEDIVFLSKKYMEMYPDVPFYIMGFSLGSFLVRTALINHPELEYSGTIIAGTGQQNNLALSIAGFVAKSEARKFGDDAFTPTIENLTFGTYNKYFKPNKTKADWLCKNKEELDKYLKDPLIGEGFTAGLFREMIAGMKYTAKQKNINKMNINIPVMFISGKQDPVGEFTKGVKRAEKAFNRAGMRTKSHFVEGRHDIFHEKDVEKVYQLIYQFVLEM